MTWAIRQGDCVEAMAELEDASIDAVVCDPPYELGFMGKAWDSQGVAYRVETWAEALRVLKPGGHLLAFGGTRTYHRLACAIEDAGLEIRDCLSWLYGSGFPKSLDVSKAIDKAAGAEREVSGPRTRVDGKAPGVVGGGKHGRYGDFGNLPTEITAPATPEAERWQGWGTALKPAWEPIIVARKPLAGTVAANVLGHGTGAVNVDGCRVGGVEGQGGGAKASGGFVDGYEGDGFAASQAGRWPANVALGHAEDCRMVGERVIRGDRRDTGNGKREGGFADVGAENGDGEPNAAVYGDEAVPVWECVEGCPVRLLDEQSGELKAGVAGAASQGFATDGYVGGTASSKPGGFEPAGFGDAGGASRFFYTAKASRAERNAGLDGFEERESRDTYGDGLQGARPHTDPGYEWRRKGARNSHPTVKPIDLMRWLVRLVTPPDGTVLDPFTGSGTTGCATILEGFDFIGIEREADYVEIAKARIGWWAKHPEGLSLKTAYVAEKKRQAVADTGQSSIFDVLDA